MIAAALRTEADAYVEQNSDEVGNGRRLVVRNGRVKERKVTVGSGTIPIPAPRVNDKRVDEETSHRRAAGILAQQLLKRRLGVAGR